MTDLDDAYDYDPIGTTNAVIAESAAAAAREVASLMGSHQAAELEQVKRGQMESATITALRELESKYSPEVVSRLLPEMQKRLTETPNLVPESAKSSPTAMARAFEDLLKLTRQEVEEAESRNYWSGVQKANRNPVRVGWRGL